MSDYNADDFVKVLRRDARLVIKSVDTNRKLNETWQYQAADLIEQQHQEIEQLKANAVPDGYITIPAEAWHEQVQIEKERDALAATVERLRDGLNQSLIHWGAMGIREEDGIAYNECENRLDETPQANLNTVKREAAIEAYLQSASDFCVEDDVSFEAHQYAEHKYPSGKDG